LQACGYAPSLGKEKLLALKAQFTSRCAFGHPPTMPQSLSKVILHIIEHHRTHSKRNIANCYASTVSISMSAMFGIEAGVKIDSRFQR